ncbi:MAG: ParA family protein [Desulfuromonadales bacterium]|nr:ParA family protein [Desulfuromonadales bacterium]
MSRLFVVTVASEKGGVGKTTIATNLAVYLKALREDLPVGIASFDNHFTVDQMFSLGPRPTATVAALVDTSQPAADFTFGQYGVQYLASERRLSPPAQSPVLLRQRLDQLDLDGLLILDTRPILDWFAEAALLAADLVLVPVKDRAALVNAATLRQVVHEAGRADRLWLVPSLVDARARLNEKVRVHEFLRFAAAERDYQVVDTQISKSPKVESLASGFSSRVVPVLTHARGTAVHGQFRQLAEFVLARFDAGPVVPRFAPPSSADPDTSTGARHRRHVAECPVCCRQSFAEGGCRFFDLRSRRWGLLHATCLEELLEPFELSGLEMSDGLLALAIDGPGLVDAEPHMALHLFDRDGAFVVSEQILPERQATFTPLLTVLWSRSVEQAWRELILIDRTSQGPDQPSAVTGHDRLRSLRRRLLRELRQAGLF